MEISSFEQNYFQPQQFQRITPHAQNALEILVNIFDLETKEKAHP